MSSFNNIFQVTPPDEAFCTENNGHSAPLSGYVADNQQRHGLAYQPKEPPATGRYRVPANGSRQAGQAEEGLEDVVTVQGRAAIMTRNPYSTTFHMQCFTYPLTVAYLRGDTINDNQGVAWVAS